MSDISTPITDAMEASIEAAGKRDVPVRVYQQLRAWERERAELRKALEEANETIFQEFSVYPYIALLARIK